MCDSNTRLAARKQLSFWRGEETKKSVLKTCASVAVLAAASVIAMPAFAQGDGYIRLLSKMADTQEPNYTGAPALASLSGTTFSNVQLFPGFDGRNSPNYSIYNKDYLIYNRSGQLERVPMTGIATLGFNVIGQTGILDDAGRAPIRAAR